MIPITSDPVVGTVVVATTAAMGVVLRRRRVRGRRLLAAMLVGFAGIALTLMLAAHCAEVVFRLLGGRVYDDPPLAYGFRAYSLLLLGAVLIREGAAALVAAHGVSRGDPAAPGAARRAMLVVLAVSVPLIPIHPFFGPLATAVGVLGLAGAVVGRRLPAGAAARPVERAAASGAVGGATMAGATAGADG